MLKNLFFAGILKVNDENSRIRIKGGMDPRIWIHPKMSCIRNTAHRAARALSRHQLYGSGDVGRWRLFRPTSLHLPILVARTRRWSGGHRQVQAPFCDAAVFRIHRYVAAPKNDLYCSANKNLKTYSIFLKFVANLTFSLRLKSKKLDLNADKSHFVINFKRYQYSPPRKMKGPRHK